MAYYKKTESFSKRPRLKDRQSYLGNNGYFLTINTHKRKKYFVNCHIVGSLIVYLRQISGKHNFEVVVYTFMPDHAHFVLTGTHEDCNLEKFVKDYKQLTGYRFAQKFGVKLWSVSYYDRILRKSEGIKIVGRYTLLNPVKGGLVKNPLDYPFSGSFVYDLVELVESDAMLDGGYTDFQT